MGSLTINSWSSMITTDWWYLPSISSSTGEGSNKSLASKDKNGDDVIFYSNFSYNSKTQKLDTGRSFITGINQYKSGKLYWEGSSMSKLTMAQYNNFSSGSNQVAALKVLLKGNDLIKGSADNDSLCGYDGNDTIEAGDGADCLFGGKGINKLTGGKGEDHFGFDASIVTSKTTASTITDFSKEDGDKLEIDTKYYSDTAKFEAILVSKYSGTKGGFMVTNLKSGIQVSIDVDGNKRADVWVNLNGVSSFDKSSIFFTNSGSFANVKAKPAPKEVSFLGLKQISGSDTLTFDSFNNSNSNQLVGALTGTKQGQFLPS